MMTSSRPRDVGSSFASRRGHSNQLSISDSSHHITETIGTLYGDDDDYQPNNSRPMSFIAAPYGGEQITRHHQDSPSPEERRLRLVRSRSDGPANDDGLPTTNPPIPQKSHTLPGRMPSQRANSSSGPMSPKSPTLRDMRGDEHSQFPLGNIENASDIAQELSNLQALRRMSMDVSNNQDPDLLPFQGMSLMAMPSIAPHGDDDEADPSRLLWVPAGVHPELAPTEFKNFLEKRVQSVKRRSAESSLSVDSLERSDSTGLRRKKSMLSRQIDNVGGRGADGYMDGAERLDRKRSVTNPGYAAPELSLDELVKDPSKAVQKLTLDSQQPGGENSADDMPILPVGPGMGLRRSTRTTYRKGGSLKDRHGGSIKGDRLPFSKRIAARRAGEDSVEASSATDSTLEAPPGYGLARVQSEPVGPSTENYSRPSRSVRRQQTFTREAGGTSNDQQQGYHDSAPSTTTEGKQSLPSAISRSSPSIPQIVETPAVEENFTDSQHPQYQSRQYPERSSSQKAYTQATSQYSQIPDEPPARSSRRPNYGQPTSPPAQHQQQPTQTQHATPQQANIRPHRTEQTLNEMAQQPSPLPGGGATRTDSLTFIPTFAVEEKKPEKKGKKERGDPEITSSKPTTWKWFKSDDKEKKKKEEKRDEEGKRSKTKAFVEKAHDNVRLDVLQTSIDTVKQKGRESLLLDRDSVDSKLEEERRKESHRKSEPKKEKDGLFANFFGGGKKKGDRDSGGKKSYGQRPLSPEPAPYRPLEPDVDYHWTRFPILEERAIYRMAHIKLANPRRALYSQVLLSNFMYAYLAKVQAMHPQIQVPQSPQQKRLQEEERKRREQEQQYLEQQQAQDSIDRYNFEYHRPSNQYDESSVQQTGDYPEDAEVYDYEHGKDNYGHNGAYPEDRQREDRNDMW